MSGFDSLNYTSVCGYHQDLWLTPLNYLQMTLLSPLMTATMYHLIHFYLSVTEFELTSTVMHMEYHYYFQGTY
jgi:hypothetical protein